MNITLEPKAPQADYPLAALLYSPPKAGKTTAVSLLPGAYCMELDRNGARFVTMAYDEYNTRAEFDQGLKALEDLPVDKRPRFLVIDTADRLEDFAAELALDSWNKRFPKAAYACVSDFLEKPKGAGWYALRECFSQYLAAIASLGIITIYLGHNRPRVIDKELVREATTTDLDLSGKVRNILCASVDVIGFCTRDKAGKLTVSTRTTDTINCGCRLARLSNRDIVLVEPTPDRKGFVHHWQEIYPQLLA